MKTFKTATVALITSLALMLSSFFNLASAQDDDYQKVRAAVTWAHDIAGNAPPAQLGAWTFPVPIGPYGNVRSLRGPTGAVDCVRYAVLYGLAGNYDAALQWLQASQAHNADARDLYARYASYSIDYAIRYYRDDALNFAGSNMLYGNILNSLRGKFNGYNPPAAPPAPALDLKVLIPEHTGSKH